ncbi:MAG TPA: peptidoglycan editing factor PgeF [Cyclobacteriaceae bacterium]|nr:peptidoglycan editing factor PgeF [Cyclobacteriaceae bacterium]
MQKIQINNLQLWQFDSLRDQSDIKHFVTDRNSFASEKEFTLSLSSTPDKEEVRQNRRLLASAMGIESSQLFLPSQVHKTNIVRVTHNTLIGELMETDALITNESNICIAVMSADCVPVLLYDFKNKAVAAIHSGWKGTAARIVEKTLHQMHTIFGTTGKDLIACIGPSVCQASYEVGEEVIEAFHIAYGKNAALMIEQPNSKAMLDLWKANKIQLSDFGVPKSQIEISDLCTVKNNNFFFSARKGDAGRFAAGIMLTK